MRKFKIFSQILILPYRLPPSHIVSFWGYSLGMQGFFIMICVAIYAVLVGQITSGSNIHLAIWQCAGYTVLLCFSLFKTSAVSRSVFNAH